MTVAPVKPFDFVKVLRQKFSLVYIVQSTVALTGSREVLMNL